ncbi:Eco57I restriction-modification methylase domain-containing protein [Ruminococcus gauvreauii]|uniref:site-specific DNA-methyltransferase (adenine-specific) n=1 Tax=Ruminococcus gauvreauii TaxID=438033 RepID=A0ABY5VJ51_9FIRM|nr:N-6 DNA methylase [Ruminococcus gauvreauii]UWP60609.1 SAM-dependent methyltransferase [Ruminococcus gauvreauii]
MDSRCQQFTLREVANEMLDFLGYCQNLYGKSLLENSCGEGNILCLAVERYIQNAMREGYNSEKIVLGLEQDIYGAEVVEETYKKCIQNLNDVAEKYGLKEINWNIYLGDVLTRPFNLEFDFIVGNPPYISYRNLEEEVRVYIKKEYVTCKKGKPDYCYAFIENAIKYLSPTGKMVYLIPNSIYKNVYAQDLRDLILKYIEEIKDYPNQKLFPEAMTSSAIMFLRKGHHLSKIKYYNVPKHETKIIPKKDLSEKWIFGKISTTQKEGRFGDFFKASMAIATQRNRVFVISREKKVEYRIESGVLRPAVSPRNKKYGNKEFIIFPYKIRNHQVINYSDEDFRMKYPNTYKYLVENKKELEERDADKSALWFEYGRSQALQNMNKKKLLVSTVVTDEVGVYEVSSKAIPYAGIYIISENGYDLNIAKQILTSELFLQYIYGIGTPASGRSLRITANDINNFKFPIDKFLNQQ